MYPRLVFDLDKIKQNLDVVATEAKQAGCSVAVVTKSFCADPRVTELIASHPLVDFLGDSRVQNLKSYEDLPKRKMLLRLPQAWEAAEAVRYADLSLNSEIETLRLLNQAAGAQGKRHQVVLMIDLGDLREGIFYEDEKAIRETAEEILRLPNLCFHGLGVNLTCYGAVIPKEDNLSILADLAEMLRNAYDIELPMVSGGNSSSYHLIKKGQFPRGINNLRLGEAVILGNETAYGERIPGTHGDGVVLEAQIVEVKTKRSLPVGEIGVDAFGRKPVYQDRGMRKRAILAVGRQDVDVDGITPMDSGAEILGASSDHLILDVTDSREDYGVGDVMRFTLGYGGLLAATTSGYVGRVYVD